MVLIQSKKAIIILLVVDIFFFCSFIIHELVHSFLFYLQSGEFGIIHFFDEVSYSLGSFAVTLAPNTTHYDRTFHELCAYSSQIIATGVFLMILYKKYYLKSSRENNNKSQI